jgi:ABC-type branched-subunit amino acid transport system ATPase component
VTPILKATNVSAGYNGHPVVHDLDIEVSAGEVVLLVGPNGAGKSTSLLSLASNQTLLDGEVMFERTPITHMPLHRRAGLGMAFVPEGRSIFMRLTAQENLRLGRGDADAALALFPELAPLLRRVAGALSGGEQQILTLARALSRHPRLLMADELSLGLAPLVVNALLQAVRRAATDNDLAALLVEQHVSQALKIADRVYVMQRGRIVMSGTVDEVAPELQVAYL